MSILFQIGDIDMSIVWGETSKLSGRGKSSRELAKGAGASGPQVARTVQHGGDLSVGVRILPCGQDACLLLRNGNNLPHRLVYNTNNELFL